MENKFGRICKLLIQANVKNGKTILEDVYFTPPYKIMHPFYENKDYMTVICMSSCSGVMAGDVQEHKILVKDGAKLEYMSQEYEKIHKMDSGFAKRTTDIEVGTNAALYYNPLPTIPFKDSAYESYVNVRLANTTSRFVMKEILTAGRCARGELFEYRYYHNMINLYRGEQLLYRDNTKYDPSKMELDSLGLYEGYTHLGTLLVFHCNKDSEWVAAARDVLASKEKICGGVTKIDTDCYVVRVLGIGGEQLEKVLDEVMGE